MRGKIPLNIYQRDSSYLLTLEEALAIEKIYLDMFTSGAPAGMRVSLSESLIPIATNIGIMAARKAIWSSVDPRLVPLDRLAFVMDEDERQQSIIVQIHANSLLVLCL